MPEYLAPGVYVEEISFRSKSIEGVSTTTTGFVGPTRYGPIDDEPELLTSLADFERAYGGYGELHFQQLEGDEVADDAAAAALETKAAPYDMFHAVRAFFDNGGARLYVKRVFNTYKIGDPPQNEDPDERPDAGFAGVSVGRDGGANGLRVQARYPGALGARRVQVGLQASPNRLTVTADDGSDARLSGVSDRDTVLISQGDTRIFAIAAAQTQPNGTHTWTFESAVRADGGGGGTPGAVTDLRRGDLVAVVSATILDLPPGGRDGISLFGLPLDPRHRRGDIADGLLARMSDDPPRRADRTDIPITMRREAPDDARTGVDVLTIILRASEDAGAPEGAPTTLIGTAPLGGWLATSLADPKSTPLPRSFTVQLRGGFDGRLPNATDYEGRADDDSSAKTGLKSLEDLEDISIIAAPGAMRGYRDDPNRANAINQALISHAQRMRYRIAVLDAGEGHSIAEVRRQRGQMDSTHAALYYPWVTVLEPSSQKELQLPPSGFVAGIYARNDRLRAVYKAPANEVVTGAIRFETMLNRSQQEVLNPEGINCFRFFEGRGYRLWGARTISSDPEWKYVNLRRYFAYLERSIDIGTQWAVFEPNGEALWANVRRTIEDFLFNEFQMGALLGEKPEKAYFVKCDRSTMTQNDLDNGRLVCQIGVAALRPAEFVIFRIGQWTADRKL